MGGTYEVGQERGYSNRCRQEIQLLNTGSLLALKAESCLFGVFPNAVKFPGALLARVLLIGAAVISLVGESEKGENMRISWSTRAMQIETMICCLVLHQKCY